MIFTLQPPSIPTFPLLLSHKPKTLVPKSHLTLINPHPQWQIASSNAATSAAAAPAMVDIDMSKNKEGIWSAKQKKVVVLWDLDNKPPRGPPYEAAMALRNLAECFGDVVDFSAYANRHAFIHLPQWVREERRERRMMDVFERKEVSTPADPYICGVCGRKCRTNLDLKKHFRQLHEREMEKKLNRMRSLKGKKRQKYKERFVSGNVKYEEAARSLITPKVGYGLDRELRRAGVFVKTVEDKPQSADWALKRQMQHSMSRGIDWMLLISDDSDFSDMLRKVRESNLRTIVVGDWDRALGSHADLWVPWIGVENGEIGEEELLSGMRRAESSDYGGEDGLFSISDFDEDSSDVESDMDRIVDELVVMKSGYNGIKISAFSEGEEEEKWVGDELGSEGTLNLYGNLSPSLTEKDLFWDSEDEEDKYF